MWLSFYLYLVISILRQKPRYSNYVLLPMQEDPSVPRGAQRSRRSEKFIDERPKIIMPVALGNLFPHTLDKTAEATL